MSAFTSANGHETDVAERPDDDPPERILTTSTFAGSCFIQL